VGNIKHPQLAQLALVLQGSHLTAQVLQQHVKETSQVRFNFRRSQKATVLSKSPLVRAYAHQQFDAHLACWSLASDQLRQLAHPAVAGAMSPAGCLCS
jgi:hypothetical protein